MPRSGRYPASPMQRPIGSNIWAPLLKRAYDPLQPTNAKMGEPEHVRMKSIKTESKILTVADIAAHAQKYRADGLVVVQAHGTFDLLHLGHVRHLEAARALGDV